MEPLLSMYPSAANPLTEIISQTTAATTQLNQTPTESAVVTEGGTK